MMTVKCLGVRGSHAVSGENFREFGGHTTSFQIQVKDTLIFIDAGTGICNATIPANIKRALLLFTHTHLDHIVGFPFLKALQRQDFELTICGAVGHHGAHIQDVMSTLFAPAFFPVNWNQLPAKITFKDLKEDDQFLWDEVEVSCFHLPHSSATLGYRLKTAQHQAAFCFDAEWELLSPQKGEKIHRLLEGIDLLISDGTYSQKEYEGGRKGFGHSAMETVAALGQRLQIKKTAITHHSPWNDDKTLQEHQYRLQKEFSQISLVFLKEGWELQLS